MRRSCKYGGGDEFYVQTRETDTRLQERIHSERVTETTQDPCKLCNADPSVFRSTCPWQEDGPATMFGMALTRVDGMQVRAEASSSQNVQATSEACVSFLLF